MRALPDIADRWFRACWLWAGQRLEWGDNVFDYLRGLTDRNKSDLRQGTRCHWPRLGVRTVGLVDGACELVRHCLRRIRLGRWSSKSPHHKEQHDRRQQHFSGVRHSAAL